MPDVMSPAETRMAVVLFRRLPLTLSLNQRHELVAEQMTTPDRTISRYQVRRCMQRWEESERGGTLTAGLCRRHVSMKRRSTPAKYRCRSSAAMPLATKALAVQLVMQTSTLYARQIRHEVHQQIGEVWASSTYARVRREAGMTRKRTTTEKREACPIAQHTYAQSIHDLGYLPEHFVFIDEVR